MDEKGHRGLKQRHEEVRAVLSTLVWNCYLAGKFACRDNSNGNMPTFYTSFMK